MDMPRAVKTQCPWRPCLVGLLLQLLFALGFFSYSRVSYDRPGPPAPGRSPGPASTPTPPAPRPLLILLWTWPFHTPVALSPCSKMLPGTVDCQLTANRSLYPQADAVIVHHREVSANPGSQLPPQPRPPDQRWVWFSLESPSHCSHLSALDGYFNLTMSYRSDSDIFTPYGWLEPWPEPPVQIQVNLSAKTDLVAWAVSNWNSKSARVQYYENLKSHLRVDVYGRGHKPLPQGNMTETLARYKFYLAFENSLHPDYITEKLWRNALEAWAVPVVLGPSRKNYERFLPPDAFIHVDDFKSPGDLARYLQELDRDSLSYQRYFRWRKTLRPCLWSMALAFFKACRQLQWDQRYRRSPMWWLARVLQVVSHPKVSDCGPCVTGTLCWLVYFNLIEARVMWVDGATIERMSPPDCPVFSQLVIEGEDSTHCGRCHPQAGGPGFYKKTG